MQRQLAVSAGRKASVRPGRWISDITGRAPFICQSLVGTIAPFTDFPPRPSSALFAFFTVYCAGDGEARACGSTAKLCVQWVP